MPTHDPQQRAETQRRKDAIQALALINNLMSPTYVLDADGREQLYLLQHHFLEQIGAQEADLQH